jgi:hypothetical protein
MFASRRSLIFRENENSKVKLLPMKKGDDKMHNSFETTAKPKMIDRTNKGENGLQNLVVYYRTLFDIEENINHYSRKEYQNAKRKFVKYSMENRVI